jgi:DNA-binding transcriptional ArsR family regulator
LVDPDRVFAALADPTRRQILQVLSHEGPLSATDLAGQFPVSRQAVVKHLSTLAHAGLLEGRRQGREVLYGLAPDGLADATAWLDQVGRTWDGRLAALVEHFGPGDRPGP